MTRNSKSLSKIESKVYGDCTSRLGDTPATGGGPNGHLSRKFNKDDSSPDGWQAGGEDGTPFAFPDNPALKILAIQSLLVQLATPSVQQDLATGRVLSKNYTNIKTEVDLLCEACLPRWLPGQDFASKLQQASEHLSLLANQSSERLSLKYLAFNITKSYKEWFELLNKIAHSQYWNPNYNSASNSVISSKFNSVSNQNSTEPPTETLIDLESSKPELSLTKLSNSSRPVSTDTMLLVPSPAVQGDVICPAKTPIQVADIWQQSRQASVDDTKSNCSGDCSSVRCGSHPQHSLPPVPCPDRQAGRKFIPHCSGCGGQHLGMNCWKRTRRACNWCGLHGHLEENCWRKSGACLICGSNNHRLRQCSRFLPLKASVFPPWCLRCGGNHLGNKCDDPYME